MEKPDNPWIYDGCTDLLKVAVEPVPSVKGGYIVVFVLEDQSIWLGATRDPIVYSANWARKVGSFGLNKITRVLVSRPLRRFESARLLMKEALRTYKDQHSNAYYLDVETLTEKVRPIFLAALPSA
ncbi:MAG: hypothetical protein KF908_10550 [Nitrosomonas sp.]|uniref:GIY-YIG nuclease family protein n=1 Tax=Nitrosomonas aestuarii TaxID=52441 RepID=A0A1I4DDC1_9PROT|nr:hypothetical protein [Nitrosomonas aestuarii]MBX3630323.1 hypothetical protein [Nitrosomonas sp.]SFK91824.1 hypothetical protein SAMN05216302_10214 [Nitrosomonas aestuarii]